MHPLEEISFGDVLFDEDGKIITVSENIAVEGRTK